MFWSKPIILSKLDLKESCDMALRVTISRDDTLILNGGGDKKQIEERCEEVHMIISYTISNLYHEVWSL